MTDCLQELPMEAPSVLGVRPVEFADCRPRDSA
jgi:hypothetical protein